MNRRMRSQEKNWAETKKETRGKFLARLRRTAMRLPTAFVQKCIGDMRRRCQLVAAAKGGHFEEGGRRAL